MSKISMSDVFDNTVRKAAAFGWHPVFSGRNPDGGKIVFQNANFEIEAVPSIKGMRLEHSFRWGLPGKNHKVGSLYGRNVYTGDRRVAEVNYRNTDVGNFAELTIHAVDSQDENDLLVDYMVYDAYDQIEALPMDARIDIHASLVYLFRKLIERVVRLARNALVFAA